MGETQLEGRDIGDSIVWLLKTEDEFVVRLRQKPESGSGDVAVMMRLMEKGFAIPKL
jgi:hypothetical protein